MEEAEARADPLDPFADKAQKRMEQDLLMGNVIRRIKKKMRRSFQRYLQYCTDILSRRQRLF